MTNFVSILVNGKRSSNYNIFFRLSMFSDSWFSSKLSSTRLARWEYQALGRSSIRSFAAFTSLSQGHWTCHINIQKLKQMERINIVYRRIWKCYHLHSCVYHRFFLFCFTISCGIFFVHFVASNFKEFVHAHCFSNPTLSLERANMKIKFIITNSTQIFGYYPIFSIPITEILWLLLELGRERVSRLSLFIQSLMSWPLITPVIFQIFRIKRNAQLLLLFSFEFGRCRLGG